MKHQKVCSIILLLLFTLAPAFAKPLYVGMGPSFGQYRAGDGRNTRVGVDGRLKWQKWAIGAEIYYKNERHAQDAVWVKSWPLTLSAAFYPLSHLYFGAGVGSHELYIDYDQSIAGMEAYENESRRRTGTHAVVGVDLPISPTCVLAIELQYSWIDFRLRPIPGHERINTDALSIKAAMILKIGVE